MFKHTSTACSPPSRGTSNSLCFPYPHAPLQEAYSQKKKNKGKGTFSTDAHTATQLQPSPLLTQNRPYRVTSIDAGVTKHRGTWCNNRIFVVGMPPGESGVRAGQLFSSRLEDRIDIEFHITPLKIHLDKLGTKKRIIPRARRYRPCQTPPPQPKAPHTVPRPPIRNHQLPPPPSSPPRQSCTQHGGERLVLPGLELRQPFRSHRVDVESTLQVPAAIANFP